MMRTKLLGLVLASLILSCASKGKLISVEQAKQEIEIDGEITDWGEETPFYVKDNIRYAFLDSDDYLYVVVEAKQQADIMKMAGQGFTIWFNEGGKRKKTKGIRYPLGNMDQGMEPGGGMGGGFGGGRGGGGSGMSQSEMNQMLSQNLDVLELIGFEVEEEMYVIVAEEDYGISVKASFTREGLFINEFAVPKELILTKEDSNTLAVGFITEEPSFGGGTGGGMRPPGGGMGGGGMGGGMRPPGGMGGGMQDMMEPIEIWTTLDFTKE